MASAKKKKTENTDEASVEKMTLEGVLISLATLEEDWEELEWLQGLILCGHDLEEQDVHEELAFVAIHDGLTKAGLRKARRQLRKLLERAAPVPRVVSFTEDARLLDRIRDEDPTIEAFLGQAIPVWSR